MIGRWGRAVLLLVACAAAAAVSPGHRVAGTGSPVMFGSDEEATMDTIDLGFSPGSGFARLSDGELADDLDRMRSIGVTWIRIDVPWSVVEAEQGSFDWSSTDRLIDAARSRGFAVLALLAYTPTWANNGAPSDKYPPVESADFARFAAEASARYAPRGVHAWEVWNEPNLADFWAPAPDPIAYAQLLSAAAEAIRAVDDEAFVISAGLAPGQDDLAASQSPESFLVEMFRQLPAGTVDAVGIHPYSFPADPTDRSERWNTFGRLPEIAALIARLTGESTPLWSTEFGAPFDPNDPQRQAEIVVEGVACAARLPSTGPVFVYATRDAIEPADELPFGLLESDGTRRPSWVALAELMSAPPRSADCWR